MRLQLALWFLAILLTAAGRLAAAYPPVRSPSPDNGHLLRLQRTLSLLSRSTSERHQTVRLLYFGQPFEGAGWWTNLVEHLRQSYPDARIVAENRAFDRHPSSQVVRAAETEVYPFRPDLVVLSLTGDPHETRRLVRSIRERTSADVLLVTDPMRPEDSLDEPTDPKVIAPDPKTFRATRETWYPWLNYVWMPSLAADYQVALADIRSGWKAYLKENQLSPNALLSKGYAFTPQADFLMLELLKPWFELPAWAASQDPWDNPRVNTYEIPRDVNWSRGRLRLEFTGNRVEAVLSGNLATEVKVLVDGQPPGELPGVRLAGRASALPGTKWPALLRVGQAAPLVDEDWKVGISGISTNQGTLQFKFILTGSKTGPDGEGTSDAEFLSRSHRVSIQPDDWNLTFLSKQFGVGLPNAMEVSWPVQFHGADSIGPETRFPDGESTLPLASGLEPRRHVLELISSGEAPAALKAVRVYRPSRNTDSRRAR